jgi:hypothetical protein
MPPKQARSGPIPSLLDLQEQRTEETVSRINQAAEQLLTRFTQITALAQHSAAEDTSDIEAAEAPARPSHVEQVSRSLQITNSTSAMLRSFEELRRIIHEVKELWVLSEDVRLDKQEDNSAEAVEMPDQKQKVLDEAALTLASFGTRLS